MYTTQKKKYLACICKKYTKEPLSETYEVEAWSPYEVLDIVKKITGIHVDGVTNALDWVEV